MRITEDRYTRDLRRYNLAREFLRHEVRTSLIKAWTNLSGNRIRTLYHAYLREQGIKAVSRHRGVPPFQLRFFTQTPELQREAASLGALCRLLGVLPEAPMMDAARHLPNLHRGELLCLAFEYHRAMTPHSQISLERTLLLVVALAESQELALDTCASCGAVLLFDYLDASESLCPTCRTPPATPQRFIEAGEGSANRSGELSLPNGEPHQQGRLFD